MLTKYKLRDLIDVTRGMSLPGEYYSETGEYIRLTMGNFNYNGGGFKENTSKTDIYYTGPIRDEYILNKGDIITPLTEQAIGLLGTTAMIPESGKYIQSQDVALITCKEDKIDHLFCYYLISSELVKKQLSAAAQQTKIRHTSPDKIMDCIVWIPEMELQKSIGKTLYDIDQKIAINTRMNAELEAMAKQLYDYWFVQFDFPDENGNPYKSSGGKMVYNSTLKREIPAGWEVNSIINIIEPLERGISYSSEDINKNIGIPMFNLACYSKLGEYRTGELKTFSGYVKSENKTYPYDMLIACTDMTQDADIIGRPILVTEEYDSYVYSMDLIKITPKEIDKFYLYYSLRTPFYHKYIKPFASGTNVKHLKVDGIENYIISIPPAYLQSLFEKIVSNLKKKEMKIINENIDLTHLRDSLLPMLMNGQVTVE